MKLLIGRRGNPFFNRRHPHIGGRFGAEDEIEVIAHCFEEGDADGSTGGGAGDGGDSTGDASADGAGIGDDGGGGNGASGSDGGGDNDAAEDASTGFGMGEADSTGDSSADGAGPGGVGPGGDGNESFDDVEAQEAALVGPLSANFSSNMAVGPHGTGVTSTGPGTSTTAIGGMFDPQQADNPSSVGNTDGIEGAIEGLFDVNHLEFDEAVSNFANSATGKLGLTMLSIANPAIGALAKGAVAALGPTPGHDVGSLVGSMAGGFMGGHMSGSQIGGMIGSAIGGHVGGEIGAGGYDTGEMGDTGPTGGGDDNGPAGGGNWVARSNGRPRKTSSGAGYV